MFLTGYMRASTRNETAKCTLQQACKRQTLNTHATDMRAGMQQTRSGYALDTPTAMQTGMSPSRRSSRREYHVAPCGSALSRKLGYQLWGTKTISVSSNLPLTNERQSPSEAIATPLLDTNTTEAIIGLPGSRHPPNSNTAPSTARAPPTREHEPDPCRSHKPASHLV